MRTKMNVVVLGPKKVGKTSLLKSLINQHDPKPCTSSSDSQFYVPTVEDTFHVQFSDFRSGDQIQQRSLLIIFHDTAGITDFNIELRKPYLQVADAFLLVYSVLDPFTFSQIEALKKYLEKEKNGASKERKEVPIVVIGTNCEMAGKKVDTENALQWASREKVKLFEVSIHDRRAIAEMVQHIGERLFHSLKDSKFSLSRKLKQEKSNAQITSLLKSLINQHDPKPCTSSSDSQFYVPTVEDTFHVQFSDFRSGDQIQQRSLLIIFHDTAGITDFNIELRKPYLQVADAFLLVYSVLDPFTFSQIEALKKYLEKEKNGASKERKEVPIVVIGTNCEMAGKKVDTENALQWASREKVKLFEVSIHDRRAIAEMVQHIGERLFHSLKDSKFSLSRKLKQEKSNAQIVMDF